MNITEESQILKGKRTKRQRPYSAVSSSSSSGGRVISSPATSSEISTVEDEVMANCLILLAQGDAGRHRKLDSDVYECKTCNRSFPSFQALGGHRASHKRPKMTIEENRTQFPSILNCNDFASSKIKIHECSICGLEFASGQALGGHMRRHRSTATTQSGVVEEVESKKPRAIFLFDLNLPAPEEDMHEPKFAFSVPAMVDCYY